MDEYISIDWREAQMVSVYEAKQVIKELSSNGSATVTFDGKGGIGGDAEASAEDAALLLYGTMKHQAQLELDQEREKVSNLSVFSDKEISRLMSSSGEDGVNTKVKLVAGAEAGDEEAKYAIRAEFTDAYDRDATMLIGSTLVGSPSSPEEIGRGDYPIVSRLF